MELQYLHFPAGTNHDDGDEGGTRKKKDGGNCDGMRTSGFYQRHFDRTGNKDGPLARRVSLVLYLNGDGWDADRDGGVLRTYVRPTRARDCGGLDDNNDDNYS